MKAVIAFVALAVAASAAACGGKGSPTTPSTPPPPAASTSVVIQSAEWFACTDTFGCALHIQVRNEGPDCARDVRGTAELFNAGGAQIASSGWAVPAEITLRAGEQYVVTAQQRLFDNATVAAVTQARYNPAWTAVRCQ
jgi:hypothetical protein